MSLASPYPSILRKHTLSEDILRQGLAQAQRLALIYASRSSVDASDLEEVAIQGVQKAWDRYDPTKGASWEKWMRRSVEWEIKERLRTPRSPSRHHRLEELSDDYEDTAERLETQTETRLLAARLLALLPPRERRIMRSCYLDGYTQAEVAVREGLARSRVTQLVARARSMILQALAEEAERAQDWTEAQRLLSMAVTLATGSEERADLAARLLALPVGDQAPEAARRC